MSGHRHEVYIEKGVYQKGTWMTFSKFDQWDLRCLACIGTGKIGIEQISLIDVRPSMEDMWALVKNSALCPICSGTCREPIPFSEVWGI